MKMPLATFEGAIRVGQEKAVIAEEITLTFLIVEAANTPVSINGSSEHVGNLGAAAVAPATGVPPLRVAINATG